MSKNDKITKEKERLMKEVLGKNRGATYDSVDAKTYLERKDNALKLFRFGSVVPLLFCLLDMIL